MASAMLEGQLWGGAAHDWAELQEPTSAPLWEAMLDAGSVGQGTRLLDAGCGAGGASLLAAERGALVNGIDAAASLVAIARQRVGDGDFRVGDVEALPYADSSFDVVLAADVLPYTAQPPVVVRELARVCVPGGRVVVAVWGHHQECAQQAILRAAGNLLPSCLSEEPFSLSHRGVLESLLTGEGLRILGGGEVSCPCAYPDRETAWHAQASAGPLQAARRLVGAGPLRAAVLAALTPYVTASGAVVLLNRFRYVATVPSPGPAPW